MLLLAASVATASVMLVDTANSESADDRKWIARCIADNKGEPGATPAIVRKYCACMNNAMDDNETRTITQFEKANPKIRIKCERAAGWK
ncbi:MAG: hypothetical protein ACRECO_05360 [Xanthobacteraceae bacterium]